MATIYERVRKVTISQLEVSDNQVTAASSFVNELGADSLDLVELIMALEEEFTTPERRVSIPDEDVEKIVTLQDAVEYLRKLGVSDHQAPPKSAVKTGFKVNLPQIRGQQKVAPGTTTESKPTTPPSPSNEGRVTGNAPKKRRRSRYERQNSRPGTFNQSRGDSGGAFESKPKRNPSSSPPA